MLQVKKTVGNTLSSNSYLLLDESSTDCWIIDIGDCRTSVSTLPREMLVKGVFLTHGHFDHIKGLNELKREFPECKIYTSEYGVECLRSGKKNFSYYHEQSMSYQGDDVNILHDGDEILLFDNTLLSVLETPGHCPSCLTYYTDKYIFTGDSFIPGVPVVCNLPRGNKELAKISAEKIMQLANAGREIYAGHDKDNWISLL